MVTREEYLNAIKIVQEYTAQIKSAMEEIKQIPIPISEDMDLCDVMFHSSRSGLTVRAYNGLRATDYLTGIKNPTVAILKNVSISRLKTLRNMGTKSIQVLIDIAAQAGITMKP